ncbi:MAG TPA: hypothetical protein VFG71_02230 [Nitrospiraceae bacterium]|nr:hypothetical protein [Nitrospiraceae bacterium]
MLNSERDAGRSVVVLGLTPPYLAPLSHEALYEIDLGVLKSETEATHGDG